MSGLDREKFASPNLYLNTPCLQLIEATQQSLWGSQFRGLSFPLVLEHKFNKICLEIFLAVPLDFYLGKSKNPNTSNKGTNGGPESVCQIFKL